MEIGRRGFSVELLATAGRRAAGFAVRATGDGAKKEGAWVGAGECEQATAADER